MISFVTCIVVHTINFKKVLTLIDDKRTVRILERWLHEIKSMKSYRRTIALIPCFFFCYCVVAFLGGGFASKYEIFPVFNWSLFSDVREVRELCEVEVLSINGNPLEFPTRFYELPSEFSAARNRDATVLKLTQRVCYAKIAGDEKKFAKLRNVLETSFLSDQQSVIYRLILQSYNPIDRWRDGSIIASVVLGEYRT